MPSDQPRSSISRKVRVPTTTIIHIFHPLPHQGLNLPVIPIFNFQVYCANKNLKIEKNKNKDIDNTGQWRMFYMDTFRNLDDFDQIYRQHAHDLVLLTPQFHTHAQKLISKSSSQNIYHSLIQEERYLNNLTILLSSFLLENFT